MTRGIDMRIYLKFAWYWWLTLNERQMFELEQVAGHRIEYCHGWTGYYYKMHRNLPPRERRFLKWTEFKARES
jgi:hypothetical protein